MELRNAKIECYRRFANPINVRLNEGLIAVIGPNEAGKSSLLDALEELNHQEPIEEFDATRHMDCSPEISATFTLESEDIEDLEQIEGGSNVSEWTLTKKNDGNLEVNTSPTLEHELYPRERTMNLFEEINESDFFQNNINRNKISEVSTMLGEQKEYLGDESIKILEDFRRNLQKLIDDEDTDIEEKKVLELSDRLEELIEHEKECPPYRVAEILKNRRPELVSFDDGDRRLKNTYDLEKTGPDHPDALQNLAELADLDLNELREAAMNGDRSRVYTLKNKASEVLAEEFSKSWVQEEVVPIVDVDGTILHLHVRTLDTDRHSPIEDRSDGLRWFVALVCFLSTKNTGRDPILLVDEAEQHLSYDAQASLIEVLESQELARTVIYTTHSAGCLPSDLGRGVRPILPDEDQEQSTIENGFWEEGEGFSPLMIAMGLSSFAFTVSRNSLFGEGPCECILLPSLIREATTKDDLRYQVAPGASTIGSESLDTLLSESGRTAFLVDGDEGGDSLRGELEAAGVDNDHIISYSDFSDSEYVLEDLVEDEIYVEAVNEELREWQQANWNGDEDALSVEELPNSGRDNAVQEWCQDNGFDQIQKTTLCQRIADKAASGETIVHPDRVEILEEIDSWVTERFGLIQ